MMLSDSGITQEEKHLDLQNAKSVLKQCYEEAESVLFFSDAQNGCDMQYMYTDNQKKYKVIIEVSKIIDDKDYL